MGIIKLTSLLGFSEEEKVVTEIDNMQMSAEEEKANIKAKLMSIHAMAKESYNVLDDQDDPEDWVLEKVEEIADMMNAVHSHVRYMKNKASELDDAIEPTTQRGW